MTSSRQLAAIMFTDIVGYTALMGSDEQKAFQLLKKNRQIQQPLVKKYNGTWIKELGDGVLASFHTVTDAVFCATSIHKACSTVEGLQLRIGIHLGEVVFENNDVFGDGVNIASRLQALAPIGGTFVSEAVYKNVSNKKEFITEFIREENLKNVSEPVKIYEIKLSGSSVYHPEILKGVSKRTGKEFAKKRNLFLGTTVFIIIVVLLSWFLFIKQKKGSFADNKTAIEKSIAVIPFTDIIANPDQGYFADGMMVEILDHLFKIEGLRIIPRNSSLPYKNSPKSLQEIAGELGVANIIEGSVRIAGNQVKISVGLFNAHRQEYLWRHTYEDDISDISRIFLIHADVAKNIASKLKSEISPAVQKRIESFPTLNREAYDLFLRGKDEFGRYWAAGDTSHIKNGIEYYKKAISLDPGFSDAYTGLGEIYWLYAGHNKGSGLWEQSRKTLQKAIALDSSNGWAYSELAVVLHSWFWDKEAALQSLQKAIELEPGNFEIQIDLFFYYIKIQNCKEAAKVLENAEKSNPRDFFFSWQVSTKMCQGDTKGLSALTMPKDYYIMTQSAAVQRHLFLGQFDQAIKLNNQYEKLNNDKKFLLLLKGEAFALAGEKLKALQVIDQLEVLSGNQYVQPTFFAVIYLGLNEMDKAYLHLEQALLERDAGLHDLGSHTAYYQKKNDPKVQDIVRRSWIPMKE